ncbi:hypothetical protein Cni_G06793 [Canna indica]|uniref:Uncharacterized protein n=1 Tax=Canna indica TaxID=4628 RepID=A0AAQ3JZ83_9LILI|nr:hypothetical protein Cni_G06793 [Canna indica]
MTVSLMPAVVEQRRGPSQSPTFASSLPSPNRSATPPFLRFNDGEATPPPPTLSSSCLETRLFYVRVSPCTSDAAPPFLTLSHLRREMGASLDINGARIPASEPTSVPLRRDRVDRGTAEVTYVSTDGVRLTGAVDFEVCDDRGNLMLCGSLERMEAPWCNGAIEFDHHQGQSSDKDPKTGWSMGCYLAASIGSTPFVQPTKFGVSSTPSIEVYIAGCFAGIPLILTQTLQLSPRGRVIRLGALDSIPEDEETTGEELSKNDGLVRHRVPSSTTASEDETNVYDPDMPIGYSYHPEGWYSEEDGQLSWFNAGVRVGLGIGLGMCVGVGIGVGLLMNSYQATTRTFKRRFF